MKNNKFLFLSILALGLLALLVSIVVLLFGQHDSVDPVDPATSEWSNINSDGTTTKPLQTDTSSSTESENSSGDTSSTKSEDPSGSTGSTESEDPSGSTSSTKSEDPSGSTSSTKSEDPSGSTSSTKSEDPSGSTSSTKSEDPTQTVNSSRPVEGEMLQPTLKPAQITLLKPVASNVLTKSNSSVIIDYSNTKDGYIMVRYLTESAAKLKVQITGNTTTYTYNLTSLEWTVFPLTDGNGTYQVKVFKNVADNRYSTVLSLNFSATLSDEFAPFLRPNQYVNYENAVQTMEKALEIVAGKNSSLEKVEAVYRYVVANISYDYQKAASLPSTYLPDLDQVLAQKKGICFDFAALMTGMLRTQNIPCKLVVGYAGTEYHAWINVWSPEQGWINGVVFFDGSSWQHMDPTFAASGSENRIASTNYTTKYIY